MPELPEVETTRRGIEPQLCGRAVTKVEVRDVRLRQPVPVAAIEAGTEGKKLVGVRRRAKYLLLDFADGSLIVHLGMSGSLTVVDRVIPPGKHDHIDIVFADRALRYRDPRRFGLMLWQPGEGLAHPLLAALGPEPLEREFDAAYLLRSFAGSRQAVKVALMDARRVVGVGNIYASESLFRAGVNPGMPVNELDLDDCRRIVAATGETLRAAIAAGGSSLRDFVGSDGKPGYFQQQYHVYGREGEPCSFCGTAILRAVIGQRSTYWCPLCQPR